MTTQAKTLHDLLRELDACPEARAWAENYNADPEAAWRECPDGSWMLWLVGRLCGGERESPERKRLALCACECARLSPPIEREDWEAASLNCLDVTERWARDGGPTIDEVREARRAVAAYAAAVAAAAAYAAADAAYAAAAYAYAASKEMLHKAADIVRRNYPWSDVKRFLDL